MGAMTARKGTEGQVNYRTAIRINRKVFPTFLKVKLFTQRSWLKTGLRKEKSKLERILIFCLAKKS